MLFTSPVTGIQYMATRPISDDKEVQTLKRITSEVYWDKNRIHDARITVRQFLTELRQSGKVTPDKTRAFVTKFKVWVDSPLGVCEHELLLTDENISEESMIHVIRSMKELGHDIHVVRHSRHVPERREDDFRQWNQVLIATTAAAAASAP